MTQEIPIDSVVLTYRNKDRTVYNCKVLSDEGAPIFLLSASDSETKSSKIFYRETVKASFNSIPCNIALSIGSDIILLHDISIMNGLVNGAHGTVVAILKYNDGDNVIYNPENELVDFLVINVPGYRGPVLFPQNPKWIPLWKIKVPGTSAWQFPIDLAYAMTVHKAQGYIEEFKNIHLHLLGPYETDFFYRSI